MLKPVDCLKASIIQFTRVPLPHKHLVTAHYTESISYFPLVGLLLGLLASVTCSFFLLFFSKITALILVLLLIAMITGAIHEDGFADCCDGLFGGYNKDRRLRIMKDSTLGTFGVLGLLFLILLKLALLSDIPNKHLPSVWIAAYSLSRLPALIIVMNSTYVQSEGIESRMTVNIKPSLKHLIPVIIGILLFNILLLPVTFVAFSLFSVVIVGWLSMLFFNKKISGYNGDCLGASQQVAECLLIGIFALYFQM